MAFQKGIVRLLLFILVLTGIGVGIYLVQHPAIFAPKATEPSATSPNLAFVFTGESNSGGLAYNGYAAPEELAPTSAVKILNNNTLQFEDLDIGTNNLIDHQGLTPTYSATAHAFELQLANSVKAGAFPNNPQVYLVKTGQGMSVLNDWNTGGTFWTKFQNRISAAKSQIPQPVQWVVWYSLGINDAIAGTPVTTFKSSTIAHINKIKAELPGAIIVMTQFQSMGNLNEYNNALSEIAASEPNVYVVDTSGAALTNDGQHWEYQGFKTIVPRMVDITKTALAKITSSVTSTSTTSTTTTAASTLLNGLISYWPMDETSGNIIGDYKGLSHGNAVGPTIVDGKFNKARSFNSINDLVYLYNYPPVTATNSLSASAWVKPRDKNNLSSGVVRNIVGKSSVWWLDTSSRIPRLVIWGGYNWTYCIANTAIPLDNWSLVTGTYDSANMKIYVNGILEKTCPLAVNISPVSNYIGGTYADPSSAVIGTLDDVATWNRALTASEVQSLMTGPVVQTSAQQPTAQISANPNPCTITSGNTCSSTISWSSQGVTDLKIRIKEVPGSLFANSIQGSQTATWITTAGATFEAYSGSTLLASLFVKGNGSSTTSPSPSPASGSLTANPNPCTITSGETCTSVISWNFPAGSDVKIRIKEAPGSLFATGANGSQAAPWIRAAGATFQAYVNNTLSQELFVKGVPSSVSPSPSPRRISASPNPCNISNGATTCSSSITWSYDSVVEIRIKETPGSLFAKTKSGTQNAPWISASGATFQVYLNNNLIDELFVKGVGPSPTPGGKTGDINNDGKVDILDFNLMIADYPSRNLRSDVDHDGDLDIFDVNLLINNLTF